MSYAFQYDVPTDEQFYRKVRAGMGDDQPKGLRSHLVVATDEGLRHISVWESRADWERFREERVQPALQQAFASVGMSEMPPRPREEPIHVVDLWAGSA